MSENGVGRGANAAVAGAWLLWSCDPVIVRYLGADFPRLVMLAIGCLCGGLIFVVPAWRGAAVLRRRPKLLLLFVCYVLFSTALADFCYVNAIKYLHPGLVGLALRSQLAFAIFAAWVFLGESISRWTALGMLLVYGRVPPLRQTPSVALATPTRFDPQRPVLGFIGAGNYASRILIPAFKAAGAQFHTLVASGGISAVIHGNRAGFCEAWLCGGSPLPDSLRATQ